MKIYAGWVLKVTKKPKEGVFQQEGIVLIKAYGEGRRIVFIKAYFWGGVLI